MKKLVSTVLSIMVLLAFSASAQASNLKKYSDKEEIKPILIEDGWNDKYDLKLRHDAVKWDKKMKKKKKHRAILLK
jgi:hypothetical protein